MNTLADGERSVGLWRTNKLDGEAGKVSACAVLCSGYADSGSYGYEEDAVEDEPAPPPPEGKWGLACLACGGGGEVACCEVGIWGVGCCVSAGFGMMWALRGALHLAAAVIRSTYVAVFGLWGQSWSGVLSGRHMGPWALCLCWTPCEVGFT